MVHDQAGAPKSCPCTKQARRQLWCRQSAATKDKGGGAVRAVPTPPTRRSPQRCKSPPSSRSVPRPPPSRPRVFFLTTFLLFHFWGLHADGNFLLFETTPTASLPHNEIIIVWHQRGIRAPSPSNVDALRALKRPRRCPLSGFTSHFFHFEGINC